MRQITACRNTQYHGGGRHYPAGHVALVPCGRLAALPAGWQAGHALALARPFPGPALIDQGKLTEEGARTHPERNKIYNCLGATTDPDIDIGEKQLLQPGCSVLLCTDGLWSQISDSEMEKVFIGRAVGQVMPALMNVAERRAGSNGDNLSAVAVTLLDDAAQLAGKPDTLDTLVTPPRYAGRQILDPNLELMHQEILGSKPD